MNLRFQIDRQIRRYIVVKKLGIYVSINQRECIYDNGCQNGIVAVTAENVAVVQGLVGGNRTGVSHFLVCGFLVNAAVALVVDVVGVVEIVSGPKPSQVDGNLPELSVVRLTYSRAKEG